MTRGRPTRPVKLEGLMGPLQHAQKSLGDSEEHPGKKLGSLVPVVLYKVFTLETKEMGARVMMVMGHL